MKGHLVVFFIACLLGIACGDCVLLGGEQMLGPSSPNNFTNWMTSLQQWRSQAIRQLGINDTNYDIPQLQWTQTSFIQPQMMAHERYFYDPVAREYTVKKYLEDLNTRYGGIDAVLIWPTYPNIGTDDRNQFELLRSMPLFEEGGVKLMIEDFHSFGVKVYFPYNPWDQGTNDEGQPDELSIAQLWNKIGADGFNGDTMSDIPSSFFQDSYQIGHPIALEAENQKNPSSNLNWQIIGWGYWSYPTIPCVSTFKWLVPKHLTNVCNRWAEDHTNDMQYAFFNGVGFESWENVWGIWNQIVPRDAEALRRIGTILRYFGRTFSDPNWEPHTPVMLQDGLYATKFTNNDGMVYTIVNRLSTNVTNEVFGAPHVQGRRYFDVYHGVEVLPSTKNQLDILNFFIEENGYGAIFATDKQPTSQFLQFLQTMKQISVHPLSYYSSEWQVLTQTMVPNPPTNPVTNTPLGMIKIPGASYNFVVNGIEIEGGNMPGVDFQYYWDPYPVRNHAYNMDINTFYIDKYPVTNTQYKAYLETSGYQPKDTYNFLKDWQNGTYPNGWDNKPVTWIGIEEARAYCSSRNPSARLPNEWEWQYAAQGTDGRLYPWGNSWDASRVPVPDKSRKMRGPDNVDAHPTGASPFGVMDLTGNVYQWTNEFVDDHTRAASLRGGNYYQPQGSMWYEPQSYRLDQHTKYLLMAPTLDRSGGIGFRCVVDAPYVPPPPCTDPICAKLVTPNLVTDLTNEGTVDWKQWGLNGPNSVNRKASGPNEIQAIATGTQTINQYDNNPNGYSWSDGSPTPSVSETDTGIYVIGIGKGFNVTVPAGTTQRTLRIYVGVYESSGTLVVSLSGTGGTFTNVVTNTTGTTSVCYEIKFKANSDGQKLIVSWTQTAGEGGNVTLQAATLA